MDIKRKLYSIFLERKYKAKEFHSFGKNIIIGKNCSLVPANMDIEDNVIIQDNVKFVSYKGKLVIKKYSVISTSCIIIPSLHRITVGMPFYETTISHMGDEDHTIIINEDVWLGAAVILLPTCEIGRGCIIGAGSIVTKKIPPYAVAVGNPARIIGAKLTKAEIIEHEKKLYPEHERLNEEYLNSLFDKYYNHINN